MTRPQPPRTSVLLAALAVLLAGLAVAIIDPGDPAPSSDDGDAHELALAAVQPVAPLTRASLEAWVAENGLPRADLAYLGDRAPLAFGSTDAGSGPGLDDADEVAIHKADKAHAAGFDGTGVRVAVVDTGVDFAHPDLLNATARVEDPESAYFLHPIAYDGASLNDYLVFGEPGPNSWYVNTSYSTTVRVLDDGSHAVEWTDGTTELSWDVTNVPELVPGEEVRIGFHPDDKLLALRESRPGVILYNGSGEGPPFDTVRADLNGSMRFGEDGEKPATLNPSWTGFDPEAELLYQDLDEDGVQDVSGGMVYFIADGVREIPYASRQVEVLNKTFQMSRNDDTYDLWADLGVDPTQHLVPGAWDLVLLFGDLDGPGSLGAHGTWVASAVAGRGTTGGGSAGPALQGMAPGAKIIGAGNNFGNADPFGQAGLWTALFFVTEGYDGAPGTGDEAHIASNSWGGADWTGWAWGSRFADYVSSVHAEGRTLFVFAAGNSGPGYGSRQSPAGGPGLLVAGASENYHYRVDPWFAFDGGPRPAFGDVAAFSSRGPSALGGSYVDVLASGEFGYGADPLNNNPFCDPDQGGACSPAAFDGSASWVLWAGTSLATPNLAGVTALVYQAFMDAHGGEAPLAETAKTIVKNGADDTRQDPFLTGAGLANALRGVRIANDADGLSLSLHEWTPGDYRGTAYPGYANLLAPGGMDSVTVNVTNHRPSDTLEVDVRDVVLNRTGTLTRTFTRNAGDPANEFLLTEAGLLNVGGSALVADDEGLFASADVVRVTVFYPLARMLEDSSSYLLRAYDWTDDGNGSYDGFDERNLMVQDWVSFSGIHGPNGFLQVHDPANRTTDGLVLQLDPRGEPASFLNPLQLTLRVDYYERADFPWLTPSADSLVVPAASTVPLTLDVAVPGDADPGLYEAAVLFALDDGNVTTLPVVVNVQALLPATLGANGHDSGPYQQGVQYGKVWEVFDPLASGDFRYYFMDLAEAANVTILLSWVSADSVHELYLLSGASDWFSAHRPDRYGPNTLAEVASRRPGLASDNGTSLRAALGAGLSLVVVRSTFLAGLEDVERPEALVGRVTVTPSPWAVDGLPLEGNQTFVVESELTLDPLVGNATAGNETVYEDRSVQPYPYQGGDFVTYLYHAPDRLRTVVPEGHPQATWSLFFHSGARDVDMGLFYDADCDGAYVAGNDVIGTAASTTQNPEVATVFNPPTGCYWVHAAGFDVDPGSLYDPTLFLAWEPFLAVAELPDRIEAGVPAEFVVEHRLPNVPETFTGTVALGTPRFPEAVVIPLSLVPDLPPEFFDFYPGRGAHTNDASPALFAAMRDAPDGHETGVDPGSVAVWLDGLDLTFLAEVTSDSVAVPLPWNLADGPHTVRLQASDLAGSTNVTTWNFTVDTVAPPLEVTSPRGGPTNADPVVVTGSTEPGASVTVNGASVDVDAEGAFTAELSLPEGPHTVRVTATDAAGNNATATVDLLVDRTPPVLTLEAPADGTVTPVATITVRGSTEPGASVAVNGIAARVEADGSFVLDLSLKEGANTVTVVATDPAGNMAERMVTVTYESPIVGLQTLVYVLAGVLAAVAALTVLLAVLYWMERTGREPPRFLRFGRR